MTPIPSSQLPSAASKTAVSADLVNILIVDDEPKNLQVLEAVLDAPNYRLVRARSGQEALLALMAQDFAVLILDVQMPDMNGFELAHTVKERRKTASIPIIFLTAYFHQDQHMMEGYGSGAVDYLHKPINVAVLRSKVAVFADLHVKTRALELSNHALSMEVAERRQAEERLRELNETLERRVAERTQALHASESQLREADHRKDEFLATLAHELRNPLAPMRNAAALLRMQLSGDEGLQKAPAIIERQVQIMSRLIDDLMDVERINQGKIALQQERTALSKVLREALETLRPMMQEFEHRVELELPASEIWLQADPVRLSQVFANLLNNAAKYTDSRGLIVVSVRPGVFDVVVSVKDNGIGIAQDRLQNVFGMFSQVETALSRSRGGLGIGLALSQRLINLHGGEIIARSEGLGLGSEFAVRLPLADRTFDTSPLGDPLSAPHNDMPGRSLRIVVADDNVDAAEMLALLLEAMGHVVLQAHDGQAAIDACLALDAQLVLLDIGMPKINGYEACEQIRKHAGGTKRTLVALTGWGQHRDTARSQLAGFDHHLIKPTDLQQIKAVIASCNG